MIDDNGNPIEAKLHDVMYVPGLNRRLFSITCFAHHGHYAVFCNATTTLHFAPTWARVSLSTPHRDQAFVANSTVTEQQKELSEENKGQYYPVPAYRNKESDAYYKRLPLELVHARLGHSKCRTLLAANGHRLWGDTIIRMARETGCLSCGIATARAAVRNKEHHSGADYPGEYVFLDIQHPITFAGLTPKSTYKFYLIVVDAYSRFVCFYGLPDKSTKAVVKVLQQYQADNKPVSSFGYLDLERIRTDAGSQFTLGEFAEYCRKNHIHLSLAAPKKQYQNHLAERTWQTTSTIACTLLVHARLPDTFWYHAVVYATDIFNVLPVQGLKNEEDCPAKPYELFFSKKPSISRFRVFGCPTVVRHWVTKQAQRASRLSEAFAEFLLGLMLITKVMLFIILAARRSLPLRT